MVGATWLIASAIGFTTASRPDGTLDTLPPTVDQAAAAPTSLPARLVRLRGTGSASNSGTNGARHVSRFLRRWLGRGVPALGDGSRLPLAPLRTVAEIRSGEADLAAAGAGCRDRLFGPDGRGAARTSRSRRRISREAVPRLKSRCRPAQGR